MIKYHKICHIKDHTVKITAVYRKLYAHNLAATNTLAYYPDYK
jgi:hypothetical protein